MAIKKQNKRSLEESESVPLQNGAQNKKAQKPAKKVKLEKALPAQNNGVPAKKAQKANKSNVKVEAVKGASVKKEGQAATPEVIAARIEKKKLKNAAKLAKKNENRKEARREEGQYKPEKILMTAEQIQLRIEAISSRPELTKTAKRRLGALKKRLQIAQGTYVPKPKPDAEHLALTKSQKRHKKKLRQKLEKLASKEVTKNKNVSEEGATGVIPKQAASPTKQKGNAPASHPAVKKEKLAKEAKQQQQQAKGKQAKQPVVKKTEPEVGAKQQQKPKGKQAKKLNVKKEEPEDEVEDDDDEDAEDEEDSNEEVDTSAASLMDATAEDSEEDDDDDEEDEDDEEFEEDDEDDDDDEDGKEITLEIKRVKPEPVKKGKQETEKKPFAKKADVKAQGKNGPAANGDSEDGKKKRFVLFVGNLSYESTADDIKKHFLTKVGEVSSVRVPTKPGTNSPRGFAYVEVTNNTDYEKGLSLHNTQLNGRRLNVEYTRGGSKSVGNRSDIVSKNKKLHAMRKQGKLAGSQKDGHKRNDRRQKARQQGPA